MHILCNCNFSKIQQWAVSAKINNVIPSFDDGQKNVWVKGGNGPIPGWLDYPWSTASSARHWILRRSQTNYGQAFRLR